MANNNNIFTRHLMALITFFSVCLNTYAAEVVYRIVDYDKTTGEFTLAASGLTPKDSWAYFFNEYGATTGNRYNQIPRNKKAELYLEGWKGCTLRSVTLSMCSNKSSGQVGLSISDGEALQYLYSESPTDFASENWFGQWVSKDLNVYVDIKKELEDMPTISTDEVCLTIKGGTSEGSVYVNSITIVYDEPKGEILESPLGWSYEKLTKKSVINDGDEVMIYRNGCAAADIDGMETSKYLDAVAIGSTSDVTSHDILRFKLNKIGGQDLWTMTDQYGRKLGATGKQALAWDNGNTLWSIGLGYEGATITNDNATYGTMRYNAPAESYARFNTYTSTSLPLPFLYRKDKQNQPVLSQSLTLGQTDITADLEDGHIVLIPTLYPTNTTDKRIVWTSDNNEVASVNGGYVTLRGIGQTTITATTHDGGAKAMVSLDVTDKSLGMTSARQDPKHQGTYKTLRGSRVVIIRQNEQYGTEGLRH